MIPNTKIYIKGMEKSVLDKLFFLDKVFDVDTIVDFGCADGMLMEHISFFEDYNFYGIDNNPTMQLLTKQRLGNQLKGIFNNTQDFNNYVKENNISLSSAVLVLSSIIHEIYSYCTVEEVNTFWDFVFNSGFKYITIRDMTFNNEYDGQIDYSTLKTAIKLMYDYELTSFENRWGKLESVQQLTHFLLKYRYKENWTREVDENYLPYSSSDFDTMINKTKYQTIHSNYYCLPFLKRQIKKDFGYTFPTVSHMQKILLLNP